MGKNILEGNVTESLLREEEMNFQVQSLDYLSSDVMEELLGQEKVPCEWWALFVGWELRQLWATCGTSIIVSVFNFMLILVTQMFVGHLGPLELAGASVASIEVQGLATLAMLGMGISVQNQCKEAYAKRKYGSLGIVLQKSVILYLGVAVIFSILFWYSGTILQAISLWTGIADQAQIYARGLIPQIFAFALYIPMQRFLEAQNIITPLAYIAVAVFVLHLFLTWLVVGIFNYGLLQGALTLSFSWWILVILTGFYIFLSPSCQKTWTGFSSNAFNGLWSHAKLTLHQSITMLRIETWYSLGLVIATGYLSNPMVSIDSFAICLNYLNWDLIFMLGLSAAASVRVHNELEGDHPRAARLSTWVINGTSILISLVFIALVFASGATLSKAFTRDAEVIKGVTTLTPLLCIAILINGLQPILSGVAVGSGRSTVMVCVYLFTYYITGLSVASGLAFMTNLGVAGIMWGMIAGFSLQSLFLFVLILRTDWEREVLNTRGRLRMYQEEESLA